MARGPGREGSDATIAAGWHAVSAALRSRASAVEAVWLRRGRADERVQAVLGLLQARGLEPHYCDGRTLNEMAPGVAHQGVVARLRAVEAWSEADLEPLLRGLDHPPLLLVLDGVQDPHNLGACLRSADGAGADAVIVPRDRAASLTATVRKVAAGAADTTPLVVVTNLARCLRSLQQHGLWLTGLAAEADGLVYNQDLIGPTALVLGAEAKGLRRLTRETCDFLAALPMQGRVESLNVSVAAGICLYEARRQRLAGG